MFNFPDFRGGQEVPVEDIIHLNNALRKATEIGYQTPSSGTSPLAPLLPQSIEPVLASATFTMDELVLWPRIPKRNVQQTLHEMVRLDEHGARINPFIREGGGGSTNKSRYTKTSVRIKYMAERRELTDVATMVGLIGPNPEALAEETTQGTQRLMGANEGMLFHADSNLSVLQYDGILPQIRTGAPNNVTNLDGKTVTPQYLQWVLGELYAAPRYGRVDTIYVEPRVHASLIDQVTAYGRHDQFQVEKGAGAGGVVFGVDKLKIMAPYGAVEVVAAPFLFNQYAPPATAAGDTPPTALVAGAQPANDGALVGTSKWLAADAGDYIWQVVGQGEDGYTAPLVFNATAVAAGHKMKMTVNDGAKTDGVAANGAHYYDVYRSSKNGAADTCQFIKSVKVNALGAGGGTLITDLHEVKRNTSSILFIKHDPTIFYFLRLLDFLRRPLAEVRTTKPFLLMLFGSPAVRVPTKCWLIDGVASPMVNAPQLI